MAEQDLSKGGAFFEAFRQPSWVVMFVGQMLLGLGLAIALVVKYYMFVFGTEACAVDGGTLGNAIRCTSTLEITAHFLIAAAGIRFAAFMFSDKPRLLLGPLFIGLVGTLLLFLSQLTLASASWAAAAIILTLLCCGAAVFTAQFVLRSAAAGRE